MTGKRLTLEERYLRDVAKPPFEFPWAGRVWRLPHIQSLDYRVQGQITRFDTLSVAELEALVERMLGPDQRDEWAQVDVPADFLMMVIAEWLEYSGEDQGEEQASSTSSKSTGTSSRRTSGATTGSGSSTRSSAKKATPKKRAPRKTAKPTGALTADDQEWLDKHQALAGSQPANSAT
ncbi:hypothetical protein Ade02nite_19800 [Paractinoplanes deccanensis]|uniref:Tail assembly chaperone n=1 Tax=Paractinoplanes deccanensis TaxID=113561 RepID=A0ABQ3Y016_9ACTN|nr:hypothetical protein [Actinoplanes deccanensis]GID73339.1 hypothetical protein Ade02nite_19800 [Actinoplanes deccanensis]